ncbi:helix-turn-helix transcriptional regulator [Tomitella gaofuii]|uniref:helix-turn-helix transcriptional regulator n=1 Tax=Tomitella gaofuii TaxID=2760083 RepID=UPI0015F8F402|nr:helix-turn-helix transcriptional regulator [Tomitella gaofuii]
MIDTLFAGTFELSHAYGIDQYKPGDVYVANHPRAAFTAQTDDIKVLTTTLPASLLAQTAGAPPDSAVEFTQYSPVSTAAKRCWWQLSRYVDSLVNDPATGASPLTIGPAGRLLAATALETFPNTLHPRPQSYDRTDATRATVARATRFIDANAHRDISLADIAAAAYVSPRAVQLAFRYRRDTTPMAYLRCVRLEHARQALVAADPTAGTTVTDIAIRWGFAHTGRFAATYRKAYGELPRTTLARR